MNNPTCKFEIGEIVAMSEFADCFGTVHPRVKTLVVVDRLLVDPKERGQFGMKPWWRIKAAYEPEGYNWHEGAEWRFEKEGVE